MSKKNIWGRHMWCSCFLQGKNHCLIFFWQMAWNFEDLQNNFILKCMEIFYHCYCKSHKIGNMSWTFRGTSKTLHVLRKSILLTVQVYIRVWQSSPMYPVWQTENTPQWVGSLSQWERIAHRHAERWRFNHN